jgi:hypothetical protein
VSKEQAMGQEFKKLSGEPGCPECELQIALYAAEELEGADKDAFEDHLDQCKRCMTALDAERRMLEMLSSQTRPDPTPALLASCRNQLEDAIDELDHRSLFTRWTEAIFPAHWLALHPAASAAMLILIGFSAGAFLPWRGPQRTPSNSATQQAGMIPSGLNEQELRSADVSGINWTPAQGNQPPEIVVQLTTEKPMVVAGTVDDSDVKNVLMYVLHNSRRFGPDVRINAVELLKSKAGDPQVQQALCQAARNDRNPAVRLMALDALGQAAPNAVVLQTMLGALVNDSNQGVRIAAMNSLGSFSSRGGLLSDPDAVKTLRDLMKNDSNKYIRLQSAAALLEAAAAQQQ